MSFSDSDVLKNHTTSKDLPWWVPNINHRITPKVSIRLHTFKVTKGIHNNGCLIQVRHVLETYRYIPPDEVVDHVYNIVSPIIASRRVLATLSPSHHTKLKKRERAWNIRPWPCAGMGQFFTSSLPHLQCYSEILSRIQAGEQFRNIGCYCGTDLRQLMLDGCPQEHLHGMDFIDHWSLGHDLYRDAGRLSTEFIQADLLSPSIQLVSLAGKIDVMGANHVLHNWDWATQIRGAATMMKLSKVGAMIVGFQIGTIDEEVVWSPENGKESPVLHNMATFERVWDEASEITGTERNVSSRLRDWEDLGYSSEETVYMGDKSRVLEFVARRMS
ncbi:hypothetical protein N0V90_008099 [Kalmusia sp. IMI 367209]|nr:hypothetical protein N0V90_008099 [Kalmusia sp. IMI 367209]